MVGSDVPPLRINCLRIIDLRDPAMLQALAWSGKKRGAESEERPQHNVERCRLVSRKLINPSRFDGR